MTAGWTVQGDQSSLANYKTSDLQFSKATGASPSFTMVHKMGLVKLDMTTGKSVPTTVTWTYSQANGSYTVSGNQNSDPHTNIYPYHTFNTTTASGYGIPVNAATAGSDCYFVVKSTSSSANTLIKFGCNTQSTKEYWSDITISNVGYGKYSVSTITSNRTFANLIALFSCVGTCQTITLPWYGAYQMECWGAKGGSVNARAGYSGTIAGGLGAYVKGNIVLQSCTLYVYVGRQGGDNIRNSSLTFNGGGGCYWFKSGTDPNDYREGRGGGATDIRYLAHTGADGWSGNTSLNTRIIVAGGGGGASNWSTGTQLKGGPAGGLIGYTGITYVATSESVTYKNATGGTQNSGGSAWYASTESNSNPGGFGYGGTGTDTYSNGGGFVSGGGSGWYGGGSGGVRVSVVGSAAGGSSFISGHPGCSSISGYVFSTGTTTMIDGKGLKWTTSNQTTGGAAEQMPTTSGGKETLNTGHSGDGYAKITSQ